MAWNRSSNDDRANTPGSPHIGQPKVALRSKVTRAVRGGTPRPTMRGVIAGTVAVVGVGIAAWLMWPEGKITGEALTPQKEGLIAEVMPAKAATNVADVTEMRRKKYHYWEQENTNGFTEAMQLKWRQERRPRLEPVTFDQRKPRYEIFNHASENFVAALLCAVPGKTGIYGPINLRGMKEDFLKSCEEPIIIEQTDDDYVRNLKKSMIETKIDLRNRMEQLSRELKTEVMKYMRTKPSDEDFADYVAAANRMLEEKGAAPLNLGPILNRKLKANKQPEERK